MRSYNCAIEGWKRHQVCSLAVLVISGAVVPRERSLVLTDLAAVYALVGLAVL